MRLILAIAVTLSAQTSSSDQLDHAVALSKKGATQEAQKILGDLIPSLRRSSNQRDLSRALVTAAEIAFTRGEYDSAVRILREAAAVHQRVGDERRLAEDWNNSGRAHTYLGNYPAAIEAYQKALALDRKRKDVEGETVRLYNLGNVYFEQGKYQEAHRLYQAAIDRANSAHDQAWSDRRKQIAVSNLAILYQRLGRYSQALDLYRSLQAPSLTMAPSEQAQLLANQGTLYRRLGDPLKAIDTYRQAQELFTRERHPFGEIGVLKNIGIVDALDLNRLPEALQAFDAARKLAATSALAQLVPTQLYIAETLRLMGRYEEARAEFEQALEGARQLGSNEYDWRTLFGLGQIEEQQGHAEPALRFYQEAIGRIESVRSGLEMGMLRRDFLADKRQVYDAAIQLLLRERVAPIDKIFELMENGRSRMLRDKLQKPDRRAVQSRLDDSTVLLEYWNGPSGGAVLVLTRNSATILPRRLIDSKALRDSILSDGDWKPATIEGGRTLLAAIPLAPKVIIVPDGPMALIPFELLTVPDGRGLLIEQAAVLYSPSSSLLLQPEWGQKRAWAPPWRNEFLAFADPVPEHSTLFPDGKDRLPKSVEEVSYIANVLPGRAEVHAGADARKEALLNSLPRGFPLLHLATHATADYQDPERSRISLTEFLFLREIYGLDFRGYDLVVLSACDTETGKLVRGEGIEGFGKAFLTAGARATVTTLWRVADEPTAGFMKQFYYGLAGGLTKAEALRRTKLRFFGSGTALAHPRYWAAFVLSGDGLSPIPYYVSWRWFGLGATLSSAAGLVLFRWIKVRSSH